MQLFQTMALFPFTVLAHWEQQHGPMLIHPEYEHLRSCNVSVHEETPAEHRNKIHTNKVGEVQLLMCFNVD